MRKERPLKAKELSDFLATDYAEYADLTLILFKMRAKSAYSA
jgi:hypothetical protein